MTRFLKALTTRMKKFRRTNINFGAELMFLVNNCITTKKINLRNEVKSSGNVENLVNIDTRHPRCPRQSFFVLDEVFSCSIAAIFRLQSLYDFT